MSMNSIKTKHAFKNLSFELFLIKIDKSLKTIKKIEMTLISHIILINLKAMIN